ncbi:Hypothetical protein GLP15_2386 [Giardia lamblia P15]|uniref:Uncharacterized protein n=1 Tax=Giardia intestinalis (strain P15) TaxID=658858 RepID=E1F512_GIAIA|nr:Hypothetical protein GLP15_2386 [Giardia lamblia P15]
MSLPITALCSTGSAGHLYAISGGTIYRGVTPVATLNHDGIKSSVSCASFWAPYFVVCAGRVISIYNCTNGKLSLDRSISCPSVVLSVLPSNEQWLISFITGDWGCLDVSTGTLSCHKGSTGVFFSSQFLGFLFDRKAILTLGSAASLIELCFIDVEKLTYERIATICTPSFPILCLRSFHVPNTDRSFDHLYLLLALSCKHAHVFSLAFSQDDRTSITVRTNGWPILDTVSRLYSGHLDKTGIYLGDETGNIYGYTYSYQYGSDLLSTPNYRVRSHCGIVKDMVMFKGRLYTCGEDGAVLSHYLRDLTHKLVALPLERACSENAGIPRRRDPVCLHSAMVYTADMHCIVIYMCDVILVSNFSSVLSVSLPGQKPNCFDEFVTEKGDLIIIVGYTISAICYIQVSLFPFKVSRVSIINFANHIRLCTQTIDSNVPNNLGVSSCHILHQNISTINLFVFIYGIGAAIVSCQQDLLTVLSVLIYQCAPSVDHIFLTNIETGVTSFQGINQKDLKALGPLTSSIIRLSNRSSLVFVYTRAGQVQIFKYTPENLQLLFPILSLCTNNTGKVKLYTRALPPSPQAAHSLDEHPIIILLILHSGKVQLVRLLVHDNKIIFRQQNSTRSIMPCNSVLLRWDEHIAIASHDTKGWLITSLCPNRFTYSQGTISTGSLCRDSKEVSAALGMCYNEVSKQCALFSWSSSNLLIQPIESPVLTTRIILPGWGSGSEINAFALLQNMLVCGSETGEVSLHGVNLKVVKIVYYCNAPVRSISVLTISPAEDVIIIGSSNSQLVCLIWDVKLAAVIGHARFPAKYIQPKIDELDIRYTFILPFCDAFLSSRFVLFLVGASIGELWLMCFVLKTRCIYLIERRPTHSVPMQLQWMHLGEEGYVVGAMTKGLIIATIDKEKLSTILAKMSDFGRMNIGYMEHALSQKPLGFACGVDGIVVIKWQMRSSLQGSIVSVLTFKRFILAASDIGYLTIYTFERCQTGIRPVRESSLQRGCVSGIICATILPSLEEELSFAYIGWDRIPHYCKLSSVSADGAILQIEQLPSMPLYNIHSVLCMHIAPEASSLLFCGSGLFAVSLPKGKLLTAEASDKLTEIAET